mgnify:CR=1 FL=1
MIRRVDHADLRIEGAGGGGDTLRLGACHDRDATDRRGQGGGERRIQQDAGAVRRE